MITEEQFLQGLILQAARSGFGPFNMIGILLQLGYSKEAIEKANNDLVQKYNFGTSFKAPISAFEWLVKFDENISEDKIVTALYWQCYKTGITPHDLASLIQLLRFNRNSIDKGMIRAKEILDQSIEEVRKSNAPSAIEVLNN